MRNNRRRAQRRNRNYSWMPFSTAIPTPTVGTSYYIVSSKPQDYETVLERTRGMIFRQPSTSGSLVALVFGIVLPQSMLEGVTFGSAFPSTFPNPRDVNGSDDYPLWQYVGTPDVANVNEASIFDSKARRKIDKDNLFIVGCVPIAFSRALPFAVVGRFLTRWEN